MLTGYPNNFPNASHYPVIGQAVDLLIRKSDTSPYGPPGVALQHGQSFVGWIRQGSEKELILRRLQRGENLTGVVEEISREFEWDRGGGLCYEGFVEL